MAMLAVLLSLAIAGLGLLGVISPPRLVAVVRSFQRPGGLYVSAAIRLALGAALVVEASSSRWPDLLRVLGVLIFVAGLATPFFGIERFRRLLDWAVEQGDALIRVWAVFAFAFGLLLALAFVP